MNELKIGDEVDISSIQYQSRRESLLPWISIKDKSPPELKFYSIYIVTMYSLYKQKSFVELLHYIGGEWFRMIDEEPLDIEYEVTHWMPLPEPPKESVCLLK